MGGCVTLYECGLMLGNKYSTFMQSRKESDVDDYIEIMKRSCDKGQIVKYIKLYRCISSTHFLIGDEK